ncbi:hypothetical protein F5H01DRAFT_277969 [Linnemannia elongata]|nr:hypothetical protein F5H01DRAFT_277969 [Linnemannia elongata]
MCYEGNGGDSQNYHAAIHWYLQTAEQGDPEGQRKVGLIYEYGAGVSRDRTYAVAWYLKAVAQGNTKLKTAKIACYYRKGQGVSWNYIEVADRCLRLAEQDEAKAQFNLATAAPCSDMRRHGSLVIV